MDFINFSRDVKWYSRRPANLDVIFVPCTELVVSGVVNVERARIYLRDKKLISLKIRRKTQSALFT